MFHIKSKSSYIQEYQNSTTDPKSFWGKIAEEFFWYKKWQEVSNCDLVQGKISWFIGGKTNISYNCLDRHLAQLKDKVAIIWEGNDPNEKNQKITYQELFDEVCQLANFLTSQGIRKGDRICIYMPMIPQSLVAMLACARIGAIHSVVFAGFSAPALASRMQDCGAKMLITSDLLLRGEKKIELFEIASEAVVTANSVESVLIYKRSEREIAGIRNKKIFIWQDEVSSHSKQHQAEILDAEDPLFILYTSGSTGKPKGIIHSTGGYMTYTGYSFQNVFQPAPDDIFFCSADIGWITGHSYLAYGPLLNAATILMFEGIPTHPTPARFWEIIEKHRVNIFYTAPTAIRALMQKGDEFVAGHDLSSLKTLGSVGEPINEEAWQWYNEKIGKEKCPIVDTWWQTETGGILISSLAGITDGKPAHAGLPLPGIAPVLLDDAGAVIEGKEKIGNLCFEQAWPSMAQGIWGDQEKFLKTYFEQFPGYYFAGDGAFLSAEGLYRIIGRVDDVIKVSGHRLGTAEIENAINSHELVAESAAIGCPHEIKGEAIYAFVITKEKIAAENRRGVEREIMAIVQKEIGAIARPEKIYLVADLPKTRSGKIMRRILKKIIAGEKDLGDVSTLVNPDVADDLKSLTST